MLPICIVVTTIITVNDMDVVVVVVYFVVVHVIVSKYLPLSAARYCLQFSKSPNVPHSNRSGNISVASCLLPPEPPRMRPSNPGFY